MRIQEERSKEKGPFERLNMKIYCTASKGCEEEKELYITALRKLGHEVSADGTDALLKADALFVCLAGEENSDVKADLNLILDKGTPVAYAVENGLEPDISGDPIENRTALDFLTGVEIIDSPT